MLEDYGVIGLWCLSVMGFSDNGVGISLSLVIMVLDVLVFKDYDVRG